MKKNKESIYLFLALLCVWCPLFMGVWDKDKPATSTSLRNSNPEILANWSAIETSFGAHHEFSTGGTNSGNNLRIKFDAPISTPTNAANIGWVYSKDISAVVELHWLDESGNELQMTSGGDLYSSAGLTVTSASTFNGSITLGAGDDLIGSSTSDITFNTNKFTVAGATGNTLIAGTLDVTGNIDPTTYETTNGGFLDEDAMGSDAANKVASQQSIKAYVDNGANKVTDGSVVTGYRYVSVNDGAVQQVFTKYFTGTLDADSETTVAHGVTVANILHVSVAVFEDENSQYVVSDYRLPDANSATDKAFILNFDTTNIIITSVGSKIQGNAYRIKIEYTI